MTILYNEIDEAACAILHEQIARGVIAPGVVDSRSIMDLTPNDLTGFTQVHLFAGGGLWSVAARMAGWPDGRPLWTASCPCQPFSAAGKGLGTDDPRHLWPDVYRLARARRPPVLVGEQVAQKAGYDWFDGVRADLEEEGYACRAVDIPALAVDAPHQRNRLYWIAVANGNSEGLEIGSIADDRPGTLRDQGSASVSDDLCNGGRSMANASSRGRQQGQSWTAPVGYRGQPPATDGRNRIGDLADRIGFAERGYTRDARGETGASCGEAWPAHGDSVERSNGTRSTGHNYSGSYWSDHEWIICHDGKARRTKPGLRLLVDGLPGRVDLWRVGGNAIVPQVAAEVLAALLETVGA